MNDDLKEMGMDWIGKMCRLLLEILPNGDFLLPKLLNMQ